MVVEKDLYSVGKVSAQSLNMSSLEVFLLEKTVRT